MTIEFECPDCSREYRVKDELAGRNVTCKGCGEKISIPDQDAADDEYGDEWDDYAPEPEPTPVRRRSSSAAQKQARKKGKAAASSPDGSVYEFDVSRMTVVGWMLVFVSLVAGIGSAMGIIASTGGMKNNDRGTRKLLGLVGFAIGAGVFLAGRFVLPRIGLQVMRPPT
ncbi:MAG: TFIIB-type zinc ribbon-containing protein [Planctomycetales bacterium]|jgi:DNA-directed RNA polymerase subunit RPC12/RpoP